ncbi:MAG: TetR/AcrR family transcriptional regulator, partial [Bradyrhizobium canariense]
MPKPSLKDAILDAGLKVMFRTGYHGTSVRDVTAAAGAPQGSFTNHFRSKEAFASEVLDRYFDITRGLVAEALDDISLTPRAR